MDSIIDDQPSLGRVSRSLAGMKTIVACAITERAFQSALLRKLQCLPGVVVVVDDCSGSL